MYDFLKKIPLFGSLPDEDLERLCEMVTEVSLPAGKELFSEGSPGDTPSFKKEIEIINTSGAGWSCWQSEAREVGGDVLIKQPAFATGAEPTAAPGDRAFSEPPAHHQSFCCRAMLFTVTSRLRTTELLLDSEKMAQLVHSPQDCP
jgi:hypothetical protein